MVDTDAVVFLPSASLIIPKRIEVRVGAHRADRIGQPEIAQSPKARAGLRQEQRIVDPEFRVVGVGRDGDYVVVASEDERFSWLKTLLCVVRKPIHPVDFI